MESVALDGKSRVVTLRVDPTTTIQRVRYALAGQMGMLSGPNEGFVPARLIYDGVVLQDEEPVVEVVDGKSAAPSASTSAAVTAPGTATAAVAADTKTAAPVPAPLTVKPTPQKKTVADYNLPAHAKIFWFVV
jgi:hypothetical protein